MAAPEFQRRELNAEVRVRTDHPDQPLVQIPVRARAAIRDMNRAVSLTGRADVDSD